MRGPIIGNSEPDEVLQFIYQLIGNDKLASVSLLLDLQMIITFSIVCLVQKCKKMVVSAVSSLHHFTVMSENEKLGNVSAL